MFGYQKLAGWLRPGPSSSSLSLQDTVDGRGPRPSHAGIGHQAMFGLTGALCSWLGPGSLTKKRKAGQGQRCFLQAFFPCPLPFTRGRASSRPSKTGGTPVAYSQDHDGGISWRPAHVFSCIFPFQKSELSFLTFVPRSYSAGGRGALAHPTPPPTGTPVSSAPTSGLIRLLVWPLNIFFGGLCVFIRLQCNAPRGDDASLTGLVKDTRQTVLDY